MISQKSKKILTRIMAGVALGASLFGIASSAGAKILTPKKTQFNFKKRQDIKNKSDLKSRIDRLAVKEAEQVLTQQQLSEEASKKRKKSPKKVLRPLKYLGLAVWGGSLLLFASCLLANTPFPLGNFVLMAMPGEKHNAVLFLEPGEAAYQVGDEFDLDLMVETDGRKISLVSAGLKFDPKKLQVRQINITQSGFRETIENFFDNNSGRIKIARTSPKNTEVKLLESQKFNFCKDFCKERILIASVKFKVLPFIGRTEINFSQDKEWMANGVFLSGGSQSNILKETRGAFLRINPKTLPAKNIKAEKTAKAIKIDGQLEDWQDIIGCDLFSEKKPQNKIEDIAVFDLAWDEENIYFAAVVVDDQITDKDNLEINLGNEKFIISDKLQTRSVCSYRHFVSGAYVVETSFSRENKSGDKFNFNIIINDCDENKAGDTSTCRLQWSEEGKGTIELE